MNSTQLLQRQRELAKILEIANQHAAHMDSAKRTDRRIAAAPVEKERRSGQDRRNSRK